MPQEGPRNPNDITATDVPSESQPDDLAHVRVVLLSDDEPPTAALVEKRLRHVRQLYALSFILRVPVQGDVDVIPVAALLFKTNDDSDIEELVPFKLQIRSAGTGSFWVELFVQMLPHVPSAADLQQWTDWLKNAHAALVQAAAIVSLIFSWVKRHLDKKAVADIKQADEAKNPVSDIMKRIAESKDVSEDDKEQIRSAVVHNIEGILGPRSKEFLQDLPPSSQTRRDT